LVVKYLDVHTLISRGLTVGSSEPFEDPV